MVCHPCQKAAPFACPARAPCCVSQPVVQDVGKDWPCWPVADEMQLAWTALERQAYSDPAFGDVNRKVIVSDPLPTALHSWGNALFPCPCLCRSQGLSKELLLANGLRGIQICSAQRPSFPRHIHPSKGAAASCLSKLACLSVGQLFVFWAMLFLLFKHCGCLHTCGYKLDFARHSQLKPLGIISKS